MPEIVEVETIKNDLIRARILSQKIVDVKILKPSLINISKKAFVQKAKNSTLQNILRIGKYLIFDLKDKYLIIHLKMTGHIFLKDEDYILQKHEHIALIFENKKMLVYFDPRRFGKFYLRDDLSILNKLGCDILSKNFTFDTFYEKLKSKKKNIKTLLLDQNFIAGLGNIYVDEALFLAKIHPETFSQNLAKKKSQNLYSSIKKTISKAIKNRGTSLGNSRSNFSSIYEDFGNNQNHLLVHTKKTCPICFSKIKKIKVNQRTSHFCEKCQD
ncbi:MAG: Formamidopyrimidine-DNA glycosylase [Candidatus Anoxychlamydiales bacterium]|nr:Formamidopyrimidine-DNA glycosylase [Candidatus Anoxychlamydiales bacterium]